MDQLVEVVVRLVEATPDAVAADDEHLDAGGVGRVADGVDSERGGGAEEVGHSGGEVFRGIVEFVRGLERLRNDVPRPGIGRVFTAQVPGRFDGR
ncbi:hypothetical protein ACFV2X_25010 [Streptomyces sp. NPDC059679]|uniref:hypothetical protein n=1 Tax=Streptomyces sp. NPDC059679 TaxID=3346903 RepID=UPI0036D194B2